MSKRGVLSSKFNMSLGFIPVIVSIILCEFITQDISIYIGAGVGALYSLYTLWGKGARIPNFLLYCTTGMLLLLSLTTLIFGDCSSRLFFLLVRYYPFRLRSVRHLHTLRHARYFHY